MLPEVARDDVLAAFQKFDRDMRTNDVWVDWEKNKAQKYAIEHEGRLYPPKVIVALAADVPVGTFSGGLQGANKILANHGFKIIELAGREEPTRPFQVFWVNQGATYAESSEGGFIWAPKRDKRGVTPGHWKRLQDVQPGDVIVHYSDTAVRAIGRAISAAEDAGTPFANEEWIPDGRRIAVEYFDLADRAISSTRFADLFRDFELDDGPFDKTRGVKQGYLWRFSVDGLRRLKQEVGEPWPEWADMGETEQPAFDLASSVQQLTDAVAKRGFIFEPWQVAAFVTALRTKPFVILAGVSGTGKSRLPCLVADATGCSTTMVPVRPDWTDSSDVLGYVDLQGSFRPGPLLHAADKAMREASRYHLCVLDEMNLARVEHYFAEVLSRIEGRNVSEDGKLESAPLITLPLSERDAKWGTILIPANLAIVGTVNMDESAHGFSRKVLDRAFTLELSDVDLREFGDVASETPTIHWPVGSWHANSSTLSQRARSDRDRGAVKKVVDTLVDVNDILSQAQLQVGYRTRDEVVMFVLNAEDVAASFVSRDGTGVDPLDLALLMKVLPRVAGGSAPVRRALLGLLGLATSGNPLDNEQAAEEVVAAWRALNRPPTVATAHFPRTAARLCLMWDRLVIEGFTSFWL